MFTTKNLMQKSLIAYGLCAGAVSGTTETKSETPAVTAPKIFDLTVYWGSLYYQLPGFFDKALKLADIKVGEKGPVKDYAAWTNSKNDKDKSMYRLYGSTKVANRTQSLGDAIITTSTDGGFTCMNRDVAMAAVKSANFHSNFQVTMDGDNVKEDQSQTLLTNYAGGDVNGIQNAKKTLGGFKNNTENFMKQSCSPDAYVTTVRQIKRGDAVIKTNWSYELFLARDFKGIMIDWFRKSFVLHGSR